jgi:hypothetical protein
MRRACFGWLNMADLDKLALRRDRGYLVRLFASLVVGVLLSVFLFGWLTGAGFSGCMAQNLGAGSQAVPAKPTPD